MTGEACGESKVPGEHRDGWVVARRYVPPEVLMDPRIEAQKQVLGLEKTSSQRRLLVCAQI